MRVSAVSLLGLLLLAGGSPVGRADVLDGLDVSVATGVVVGKVSATDSKGEKNEFTIGGVPFAAILNRDLAERWTGGLQAQILLDVINKQMIRQGFSGSMAYHLLGGARRIESRSDVASSVSTSRYNVSFVVRGGIFNYAASNDDAKLSGSVWEVAPGIEYRQSFSERHAAGLTALATAVNLPASVDRLDARMAEIQFFWRTYL